jgi:hypothetical protein
LEESSLVWKASIWDYRSFHLFEWYVLLVPVELLTVERCSHSRFCKQARDKTKPDATAVYVPANQTARAIEEAIEAEIPLVVAVAEHVPIHDILRVSQGPLSCV